MLFRLSLLFSLIFGANALAHELSPVFCATKSPVRSQNDTLTIDSAGNITFIKAGSDSTMNDTIQEGYNTEVGTEFVGAKGSILSMDFRVYDRISDEVHGYDSPYYYVNHKGEQAVSYFLCRFLDGAAQAN